MSIDIQNKFPSKCKDLSLFSLTMTNLSDFYIPHAICDPGTSDMSGLCQRTTIWLELSVLFNLPIDFAYVVIVCLKCYCEA